MNIIIQDTGKVVSCRPDTSWERENKDVYTPDFVTGYDWAPVIFVRISKAGKCVGAKFATRYYDAVNYGLLLYPVTSEGRLTIMDRTSFLPFPMYNRVILENGDNTYELKLGDKLLYSTCCGNEAMIEAALVNVSKYISLRIGDLVAIELQPPAPLPLSAGENHLSATFCDNWLFDFHIK
ncbi:MAG: hypothetical protein LUC24_05715 [Bacteroidales bacterium]|nr:hypothetical protein [Bacteroidales bacterium]